jgi:hypothetical protein
MHRDFVAEALITDHHWPARSSAPDRLASGREKIAVDARETGTTRRLNRAQVTNDLLDLVLVELSVLQQFTRKRLKHVPVRVDDGCASLIISRIIATPLARVSVMASSTDIHSLRSLPHLMR